MQASQWQGLPPFRTEPSFAGHVPDVRLLLLPVCYPKVHLHAGLYAQTRTCKDLAAAIAGIGTLILMQALCRAGKAARAADRSQTIKTTAAGLHAAIQRGLASGNLEKRRIAVVFKTRIALCKKRGELATPTRSNVDSAVEDWSIVQRAAAMGFREDRHSCQMLQSSLRSLRCLHSQALVSQTAKRRATGSSLHRQEAWSLGWKISLCSGPAHNPHVHSGSFWLALNRAIRLL